VVLSGAATPTQLESNLAARKVALDEKSSEELDALREDAESYWSTRSGLAWN
jgi:aryl-alcohol dehydrogenase-like predicted oxidoreductase